MNASARVAAFESAGLEDYRRVRSAMPMLAANLSAEDLAAQSMADCSPGKWHLAHSTWFFEAMLLSRREGYQPVDPRFQTLFNSYYEALGPRVARAERGLMTRPSLDDVLAYRAEVDRRMEAWLSEGPRDDHEHYLFVLGLHHEQQHQELFLMDMLNLMSRSPLDPKAFAGEPRAAVPEPGLGRIERFEGGLVQIGHAGPDFAFDNEGPAHRVWLEPYGLSSDLVTCGEYAAFIADGGYDRAELWLADGWATVSTEGWKAPLYWRNDGSGWTVMGLAGRTALDQQAPVRHLSFYEADAFARWVGKRLPTEAEWEHAARYRPEAFSNLHGEVWQWTSNAYAPYPGFRPTEGTASEYNGKFMANQMVLRGSSFATPPGHARDTYRNFFYPQQRWAFMGLRLAEDLSRRDRSQDDQQGEASRFRRELLDGLSRNPKVASPKWFYDAEGSRLFEDITRLPEYYPTRQEAALLRTVAPQWVDRFKPGAVLVEFGSGASEKTRIVLDEALRRPRGAVLSAYVPIDISADALNAAATSIAAAYPELAVAPMVGDFLHLSPLPKEAGDGQRIGFFPGSTIGNLEPAEAIRFLEAARGLLGPDGLFVLGIDLVKSEAVLVAAYDDAQGVTAAFNRNLLVRANRDLGADFDIDAFRHCAIWNAPSSRMEMHLVASRAMTVTIGDARVVFAKDETIHTESSRKFTATSVKKMAEAAGWTLAAFEQGSEPAVGLALLSA